MRDSTIFYRSFFEAIKELQPEHQSEIYNAIFEYSLNFNEVKLSGISKTVFTLIKPQIDANIKRFNSGKQPKTKQTESKEEAKPKRNTSKSEANNNNNDNNNDNPNKNENILFESFWGLYPVKVAKAKCKTKFESLPEVTQQKIISILPAYIAYKPFETYNHPNPETFLNQKRYEDGIPEQMQAPQTYTKAAPVGKDDKWYK